MKYKLVEIQSEDCACGKSYQLVEDLDGYDLIQLKRGNSVDIDKLVLQPGEPAFVLDTGRLYIGGSDGTPILINGNTGSPLAVIADYEDEAIIEVSYSDMLTADGTVPTANDVGKYLILAVLDATKLPIGEAALVNWSFSPTSATFKFRRF